MHVYRLVLLKPFIHFIEGHCDKSLEVALDILVGGSRSFLAANDDIIYEVLRVLGMVGSQGEIFLREI